MDVVTGAMRSLAPKLLQLLGDEYRLQKGLRKKVQSLSVELESIYEALRKVGEVPPDQLDGQVRIWAHEVREASYDMEDVLDTFIVRVDRCEPVNTSRLERAMKKMGNLLSKVKARRDIGGAIEVIKKQLQEVADRRARYKIDEIVAKPVAGTSVDPRLLALYTKASELVGIDEPRDTLIEMLSVGVDDKSSKHMKIISIVGFGGLGKTTLAKAVYDKVNPQFDCGAFVPVGQNPDPRKVLRNILIDLINHTEKRKFSIVDEKRYTSVDLMELDERQLIDELRKFLNGKRYFIVVDDLWDTSIWGIATNAFVESNRGSRILVTSRNAQVSAEIGDVYRIKELSDSNSRILLYTRTFGIKEKWPDNNEVAQVSHKILHKCQGVPLAIITIASLLASKQIQEWPSVYDTIGFGHGDNTQVKKMMKILSFSYHDLPCHLRTCMLYLSAFPEDYYVDKGRLIWRWIAEGLVHAKEGEALFEVANSYFHELINRSMVLPSDTDGVLTGCRVHDMVLRMIWDMSREENFFTVQDREQWSQGNVRRLALHRARLIHVNDMDMTQSRSLNAIFCHTNIIPPVSGFQFLRVLALEDCETVAGYLHIKHIGKLLHLRYLGLSFTPTSELPKEIGNLKFLQTLMLDGTGIEELPTSLGQLTKLMCLHADEKTRVPDWIGKLTSLVELEMYPSTDDKCFVKELGKLRKLRVLKTHINVQDEGQARDLLESLSNLQKMEIISVPKNENNFEWKDVSMHPSLVLYCNLRMLDLTTFKFPRLPASINPDALPNLYSLSLSLLGLNQQDMEIIMGFRRLCFLFLNTSSRLSSIISISSGDRFQNLKYFCASFYPLKFEQGAMPSLEVIGVYIHVLHVKDDKHGLIAGLGNLYSLRTIAAWIDCSFCFPEEADEVEAELRHAVNIHPNCPNLGISRICEDQMVNISDSVGLMERRQQSRRTGLGTQVNYQLELGYKMLLEATEMDELKRELNLQDANNKVQRFLEQYKDTDNCVQNELQPVYGDIYDRDLNRMTEDNAAMERALELITVEYPRLAAMLEELRTVFTLQGAMTRHEVIDVSICVRDVMVDNLGLNYGLGNLSTLQGIKAHIDCYMCSPKEVEKVEAELRDAVFNHPNRPTLEIIRYGEDEMLNSYSRLLERQIWRAGTLWGRVKDQMELYKAMHREAIEMGKLNLNLSDAHNKVQRFVEQSKATYNYVHHELLPVQEDIPIHDRDLNRLMKDIASLERVLKILAIEYPQFAATLEELRTAFSLQV